MLHFGPHLIVLTSLPKVSYRRHVVEPSTSRLTTPFPHWDIMKCWRHVGTTCHISCRFSTYGRHVVIRHCQLSVFLGLTACGAGAVSCCCWLASYQGAPCFHCRYLRNYHCRYLTRKMNHPCFAASENLAVARITQ